MSKHTAGPWTYEANGNIYANDYKKTIARVNGPGASEEDFANALLMAAAPELLTALKWMMDEFLCHVNFNPQGGDADAFHAYLNQARLAIQKAEGRG